MNRLVEYIIPFRGMKEGEHLMEFHPDGSFFECFEESMIETGDVCVNVKFTNRPTFLHFDFRIKGTVTTICDRCLDSVDLKVSENFNLVVKFGDTYEEDTNEVIMIPASDTEIDLSKYIFEFIEISLPVKKVHEDESQCNKETIEKLKEHTTNTNNNIDPRWEQLKGLIN